MSERQGEDGTRPKTWRQCDQAFIPLNNAKTHPCYFESHRQNQHLSLFPTNAADPDWNRKESEEGSSNFLPGEFCLFLGDGFSIHCSLLSDAIMEYQRMDNLKRSEISFSSGNWEVQDASIW
jgi:hypothetical protein